MYPRKILNKLNSREIKEISLLLEKYFYVDAERIYNLIFQVDSIDTTLHLLTIHSECKDTLDSLVYDYLSGRDNREYT